MEAVIKPEAGKVKKIRKAHKVQKEKHYTYADYCKWPDDERWELIDGRPYAMAPAPGSFHQSVSGEIYFQLKQFLRGKVCKAYISPLDVRLNADTKDNTVVQPDVLVVCDPSKIDEKGCVGAPDMVVEVLSPSSLRHDRLIKFNKYLEAGVREYWIVDPESKTVSAHILKDGAYITSVYSDEDTAPVHVLESCNIDLGEVFST